MQINNHQIGRVVIFGAGIAGLTAAHVLSPYATSIDIYEKNPFAGGLARTEGDDMCNTREISWRVYFHFYKHLFEIMREIPSFDNKSVYDHLVPYHNVIIPQMPLLKIFNPYQLWKIVRTFAMSNERMDSYDVIPWKNFIGSNSAEIPQWLGMDRFKGSTVSVQRIGLEQQMRKGNKEDYVLDGPTNKVWFDPWVKELQKRNVKFHFNSHVTSISVDPASNAITGACISQKDVEMPLCITSDIYILALPVESIANLVPTLVPNAKNLSDMSKQVQLAFQLHLKSDESISFGLNQNGIPIQSILIKDSPWALILESKTISWNKNLIKDCPTIQWSISVCQANVPGIYVKKSLINCTESEAKTEIIAQITNNQYVMDYLQKENPKIDILKILNSATWSNNNEPTIISTYKFDNPLQTYEPKFSNNAGTKAIRPSVSLGPNAFLASAYVKETIDIFSMEAATIAGKLASAKILEQFGKINVQYPDLPDRPYPLLNAFRGADHLLFLIAFPDILTFIVIILVFIFVIYITMRYVKST